MAKISKKIKKTNLKRTTKKNLRVVTVKKASRKKIKKAKIIGIVAIVSGLIAICLFAIFSLYNNRQMTTRDMGGSNVLGTSTPTISITAIKASYREVCINSSIVENGTKISSMNFQYSTDGGKTYKEDEYDFTPTSYACDSGWYIQPNTTYTYRLIIYTYKYVGSVMTKIGFKSSPRTIKTSRLKINGAKITYIGYASVKGNYSSYSPNFGALTDNELRVKEQIYEYNSSKKSYFDVTNTTFSDVNNKTFFFQGGLKQNKKYKIRLTPYWEYPGTKVYGDYTELYFTTKTVPKPTGVKITNATRNSITIQWNKPAALSEFGYPLSVEQMAGQTGSEGARCYGDANTCTFRDLKPGTHYFYDVWFTYTNSYAWLNSTKTSVNGWTKASGTGQTQ